MADFKQMAMDAYNQRNNQNVSEFRRNIAHDLSLSFAVAWSI